MNSKWNRKKKKEFIEKRIQQKPEKKRSSIYARLAPLKYLSWVGLICSGLLSCLDFSLSYQTDHLLQEGLFTFIFIVQSAISLLVSGFARKHRCHFTITNKKKHKEEKKCYKFLYEVILILLLLLLSSPSFSHSVSFSSIFFLCFQFHAIFIFFHIFFLIYSQSRYLSIIHHSLFFSLLFLLVLLPLLHNCSLPHSFTKFFFTSY